MMMNDDDIVTMSAASVSNWRAKAKFVVRHWFESVAS